LAERLKRAGYGTAAVTSFTWLRKDRGFGQGFDRFDESPFRTEHPERSVTGPLAVKAAREAYDELSKAAAPIFLWVHLFDAHAKYLEHDGVSFGKRDADRYDAEIAFVDKQLGDLMQTVDRSGRASRTVWVVHGSNGEAFGEHGAKGHGNDLYEEMIRVPLVIAAPGAKPGRYEKHAVSTLDIAPTLLELAAQPRDGLDGSSLGPVLGGDLSFAHAPVLAYAAKRSAVIDWPFKLMVRRHEGGPERLLLFDLGADPDERRDVAAEHNDELRRLDELRKAADGGPAAPSGARSVDPREAPPPEVLP
jgi:choline-sulfatase